MRLSFRSVNGSIFTNSQYPHNPHAPTKSMIFVYIVGLGQKGHCVRTQMESHRFFAMLSRIRDDRIRSFGAS